jgi:phosphate transport system permease protein
MANVFSNKARALPQAPSPLTQAAFQRILVISALAVVALALAILLSLIISSFPSLRAFGLNFFFSRTWDPVSSRFGAAAFLIGTLLTSFLALLICLPFTLAISIFIGEYFREGILSSFLKQVTELLAGIPSVIYGFWGLFVLVPIVRNLER